jgi:hypothetical protein
MREIQSPAFLRTQLGPCWSHVTHTRSSSLILFTIERITLTNNSSCVAAKRLYSNCFRTSRPIAVCVLVMITVPSNNLFAVLYSVALTGTPSPSISALTCIRPLACPIVIACSLIFVLANNRSTTDPGTLVATADSAQNFEG